MGDSYIALVDPIATQAEAKSLATRVFDCLYSNGIIENELAKRGYRLGMGCEKFYDAGQQLNEVYEDGELIGTEPHEFWKRPGYEVEIVAEPWINWGGMVNCFHHATCSNCSHQHEDGFLQKLTAEDHDKFMEDARVPEVACSVCGKSASLHQWECKHHLGFVQLAIVFHGWPSFDAPEWKLNIPNLISEHIGRKLVLTYGKI